MAVKAVNQKLPRKLEIYQSAKEVWSFGQREVTTPWYWRFKAANGKILATGHEDFTRWEDAEKSCIGFLAGKYTVVVTDIDGNEIRNYLRHNLVEPDWVGEGE